MEERDFNTPPPLPTLKEHISSNCLSDIYTHFSGEVNSHSSLTNVGVHFTLNFLQVFCHSNFVLFNSLQYAREECQPRKYWAITNNCIYCIQNIVEEPIICNLSLLSGNSGTLLQLRLGQSSVDVLKRQRT